MRIGFEAKKMATNATGIGNYSRGVARLVRENTDWQCVFFAPRRGPGLPADAECVCAPGGTRLGREWWRCRGVVEDIRRRHIDLFHGLSNELPFGIGRAGCKTVVTIHDLIFLRYPGTYGTLARRVLKAKTLYACRHADRIIAASECTKRDLMAFYHVPEERISVVYQGCDPRFRRRLSPDAIAAVREKYGLPARYVLSVGTFEPRKNHMGVLRAASMLPDDVHVALAGKTTSWQAKVEDGIGKLGLQGRAHVLNHVPTDDLPALYQGCAAFVYLSFFEGFGIPVLEASASGVPVVAASGSCLEEVGGPTAWYCDPADPAAAADCLKEILADPNHAAARASGGQEHARRFSDREIAQKLMETYYRTIEN